MESERDIHYMQCAFDEAKKAFIAGEVPVGAVLVKDDEIIARTHNNRETSNDPSGHAEMLALRAGASFLGTWRLTDATLYVTKEPCIMCAGAMVNARIGRLVFGCSDEKGGAVCSLYSILSDSRLNHQVEVVSGVLAAEAVEILQQFFRSRRQA
jgi:tRNA(adenine34) deaminase